MTKAEHEQVRKILVRWSSEEDYTYLEALQALCAVFQPSVDALTAEFERGRQQGMKQERALWELARTSQEIEGDQK